MIRSLWKRLVRFVLRRKYVSEVRIPEEIAKKLGWKPGDRIQISVLDKDLSQAVIQKVEMT